MKKKIIFWILTALFIVFIFSNSFKAAEVSKLDSGFVMELVNKIVSFFSPGVTVSHQFVRKAAHFSEYAFLGLLVLNLYVAYEEKFSKIFSFLFIGLSVSVTDETIQLFASGRSGEVADILLDFSGFIIGMIFTRIFITLLRVIRKKEVVE